MEWIKCSDTMPPKWTPVLVWDKNFVEFSGYFIVKYERINDFDYWDVCNDSYPDDCNFKELQPTHWALLPKEPKN